MTNEVEELNKKLDNVAEKLPDSEEVDGLIDELSDLLNEAHTLFKKYDMDIDIGELKK